MSFEPMNSKRVSDNANSANSSGLSTRVIRSRNSGGSLTSKTDLIAEESAIAMVYNGISHAVMMATPQDLEDFAMGFSLTEGIISQPDQIRDIKIVETALNPEKNNRTGYEVQIDIASSVFMQLKQRRRQLSGRTGCGICGIESLQAVVPGIQPVRSQELPDFQAVEKSIDSMREQQHLQSQCGAVHAAAYADFDGNILELREDVGRHNALDKLLGCIATKHKEKDENRFVLVSSRASFEMVAKSASQSISTLVAVSAPTDLAIELAEEAQMNLIGFVRPGRQLIYSSCNDLVRTPRN